MTQKFELYARFFVLLHCCANVGRQHFNILLMINRELIRLKIVQLVYAYYQNNGKTIDVAEKELRFSLTKAYDLYNFLLQLMVETRHYAIRICEAKQQRAERLNKENTDWIDRKIVNNRLLKQLDENKQLQENISKAKLSWVEQESFIKKLYNTILDSETFEHYMKLDAPTYADDKEMVRRLYKTLVVNNEEIDGILEEISLYWNDDKQIVDSFVMKTIKRFTEESDENQPLLPEYDSEDDCRFAITLFRRTLDNADEYRELIKNNTKNWEFNRLTLMDVIIMQIALAEIINFPTIPLNVSFNEYLDIAKVYSTPKSASYINGMLDNIVKKLKAANKILK